MKTSKRLIAPATMMFGTMVAAVAFAVPASAVDSVYPPVTGSDVLGTSAGTTTTAQAAGTAAGTSTDSTLAFTGGAVAGIGALGGLLLVGGTTLVVAGRRHKGNA